MFVPLRRQSNKPFCDITHGLKGFDGSESADHGAIADRRDSYPADGVTVYDDRTVCAHFGQCTARFRPCSVRTPSRSSTPTRR